MIALVDDPAQSLHRTGAAWVGIAIPTIILLLSIAVSFFLYWYFVKNRAHK